MAELREGPRSANLAAVTIEGASYTHTYPEADPVLHIALCPDIGGLRTLFDSLCLRLASHGFAVCAIEPFAAWPAEERVGWELPDRMAKVKDLGDDDILDRLATAADHLDDAHGSRAAAVMGFCMGGYYTLKAAASGRFAKAVSFYGMVRTPDVWQGPGHRSPLDTVARACPTIAILGGVDQWVPPDDIAALQAALAGREGSEVVVYPDADHGFLHDPSRPAHRADDAADAWDRVLRFLQQ